MKKRIPLFFLLMLILVTGCKSTGKASSEESSSNSESIGYLFSYFTGNTGDEEAIRFAVSLDAFNYFSLNGNNPILDSKAISSTGGVRDPHLLRGEDGKTFYMVVTDMVSARGWDSNRAMVLLKSNNLTDWSHSIINIQEKYDGQEELKRVWAPQTIYDKEAKKYMVYFSMKHGDGPDIIYYAYTNDEFTDFITEPQPLFIPKDKKSCIDGDIIYHEGKYHLFYKTEGHGNSLKKATTHSLTSGEWQENDKFYQQTNDAVEGSSIFKLIDSETYILMYDVYMKGRYEFTQTTNLEDFTIIDENKITMDFKPRHGSVIPITKEELKRIIDK